MARCYIFEFYLRVKTLSMSRSLSSVFTATVMFLLPALACAQVYPTKPIRIVVPFQPGGSMEVIARLVGQKLTAAFGQAVIIENRPGAGGTTGIEFVAKAPADGYTLLAIPSAFAINPSLYSKAPYDPIKDFEPVSALASYSLLLACHPSLPVRSVKALIALAKAQPGSLNYSSGGIGTSNHVAAELFAYMAGVRMTHIAYKGGGPALMDLIGGHVHIMFAAAPTTLPFVKSGKLRVLGVSTAKRSPFLPDVPTIAEAGIPGYEVNSWSALFAPAGTPAAIVKSINAEVGKGLRQADALEVLERQGLEQAAGSQEDLASLVRTEVAKWTKVIKATGIKPL
jgi:tripartite-type tricarboxylate transporter receptor subunit TctC